MPKNDELITQIAGSDKACFIQNLVQILKGMKRIIQGIKLWNSINTCQTNQLSRLPRQIKPLQEVALTNIRGKANGAIKNNKETSFLH